MYAIQSGGHSVGLKVGEHNKYNLQAWAELGQAQVKLDDIVIIVVEVVVKAIVEVEVQLLFWVGGWVVG